jgi:hypothetical protein
MKTLLDYDETQPLTRNQSVKLVVNTLLVLERLVNDDWQLDLKQSTLDALQVVVDLFESEIDFSIE